MTVFGHRKKGLPTMPLRVSHFVLLGVLAVPLAALAAEEFVTAKGRTVAMPDIDSMTCREIEETLIAIDSTRYRENAPVNPDPADDTLYAYEQDLAEALFRVCVVERQSALNVPVPVSDQTSNQ